MQIGVVYNYLPLMIFPLFVALDRLDPALREGSKDLFADRLATFREVTLPLARPGIVAGIMLVFVPLAGDYITANLLGGAKGNMPGNLVASQFTQAQNPPLGAAVAVILVIGILGALGLGFLAGWADRPRSTGSTAGSARCSPRSLLLAVGTFALGGSLKAAVTVLVVGHRRRRRDRRCTAAFRSRWAAPRSGSGRGW